MPNLALLQSTLTRSQKPAGYTPFPCLFGHKKKSYFWVIWVFSINLQSPICGSRGGGQGERTPSVSPLCEGGRVGEWVDGHDAFIGAVCHWWMRASPWHQCQRPSDAVPGARHGLVSQAAGDDAHHGRRLRTAADPGQPAGVRGEPPPGPELGVWAGRGVSACLLPVIFLCRICVSYLLVVFLCRVLYTHICSQL